MPGDIARAPHGHFQLLGLATPLRAPPGRKSPNGLRCAIPARARIRHDPIGTSIPPAASTLVTPRCRARAGILRLPRDSASHPVGDAGRPKEGD